MKTIATTPEDTTLVEVSRSELVMLQKLAGITDGKILSELWIPPTFVNMDYDLTDAFRAIIAWMGVKNKSNELRDLADKIDKAIGAKDGD